MLLFLKSTLFVLTYIKYKCILISELRKHHYTGDEIMTTKELRVIVRNQIVAQGGKLYNFNCNDIKNTYGVTVTDIQNAINYFQFSPQQAKFRAKYNFH